MVTANMAYRTKRLLDLVIAVPLLALAAPFLAAGALLVRVSSPGPILFRQTRVGRAGQRFEILKFRSMYIDNDDSLHRDMIKRELELEGSLVPNDDGNFAPDNDPRVTPAGRFLRRSSLDELPQLVNVVRGDMSLVGPRPLIDWERDLIPVEDRVRERVPPGITGLFQIEGRKTMTTPEMLVLDRKYVEQISLTEDLRILARTPLVLLSGKGAV